MATAVRAGQDPGTCPVATTSMTCSSEIAGSMSDLDGSSLGLYTCGEPDAGVNQTGPDDLYAFACQASGPVTLVLEGATCDFDLYVLDVTCDSEVGCLAGDTDSTANARVTFDCLAGETYIVSVEGFGFIAPSGPGVCESAEPYDLNVEVGAGTGCPEDCDDALDNDLDGDTDCSDSDCGSEPVCSCDMDGDGYDSMACDGTDCDDTDPLINPGMMEICGDGIDNDCNAATEDSCSALVRDGFEDL